MEAVYDLRQHEYCVIIYIGNTDAYLELLDFSKPKGLIKIGSLREKASITYDKYKARVLSWSYTLIGNRYGKGDIQVTDFMKRLYYIYKNNKGYQLLTQAIADFLKLAIKKLMEHSKIQYSDVSSFHYAFVVPSKWEEEIREDLIRPIFIQANLICKEDHRDRLLFISDIESICYTLKDLYGNRYLFERGQNTAMCRITPIDSDTALIKLDLIKTTNTLFDIPKSILFPKVMRSNSLVITSYDIKCLIKDFLKSKLFLNDKGNEDDKDYEVEKTIELIKEAIYSRNGCNESDKDMLMRPLFSDTSRWKLSKLQEQILKSIRPFDICATIGKNLFVKLKNIFSNQFVKKYEFLIIKDQYHSELQLNHSLDIWLTYILSYNIQSLNDITNLTEIKVLNNKIQVYNITEGGAELVTETIRNSNIYCSPRILTSDDREDSSSMFTNSKPDIIINLDVSLKSTLLSYSTFNETEKSFNQSYFKHKRGLPSLEQFYDISNEVTLRISSNFIAFADTYLMDNLHSFSEDKKFMTAIETLLSMNQSPEKKLIFTQKLIYIEAFLLMYLFYIKEAISNKLSSEPKSRLVNTKIGYVVSIERILLDQIIGTKKDLEELIYESGLLKRDDKYRKLRIVTQGEGVLSMIQQSFKLEFPIKSYFVLAQLREDYIQLTLNQIVTTSGLQDKHQESIIIEDKIIHIQNIYESLCLSMWNNLVKNNSFIHLCYTHGKCDKTFELFSLKTKKKFMKNIKHYIINNVLATDANLQDSSKNRVSLSQFCDCKIWLNVKDIIEISFEPFLKEISRVILSSLINEKFFGKYKNIKYHFNLIYFNHNNLLKDIFGTIMKQEADIYNPTRGIETSCMTIPKLPYQLSYLLLPFFYQGFQNGTLYRIYDKNYAVTMPNTARKWNSGEAAYLLLKKRDRITDMGINRTYYMEKPKFFAKIVLYEYELYDFLNDPSILTKNDSWKHIKGFIFSFVRKEYAEGRAPIIFTIRFLGYSSSIQLSARLAGKEIEKENIFEIGQPMTLCRH